MKKLLKNTLIVIFTILITLCLISKISFYVRPTDTDGVYSQIETFHSLPENTIEVIAYGSSHVFRGLNTMEMYKQYGIGAYNYSWNWQKINTAKMFIEDSLLTQKPKVILIETYMINRVLDDVDMNPEIYYSRYIKDKNAKFSFLKQCFGFNAERYLTYCFPILAFHDNWNTLNENSYKELSIDSIYSKEMGFSPNNDVMKVDIPDYQNFEQLPLSESAISVLDDIVKICDKNNIEIVFYLSPFSWEFNYSDATRKYAEENGCGYIDLFEKYNETGLNEESDFADEDHLNTSGSKKVANYLGKYLKEKYDLTDMRESSENIWNQAINSN